MTYLHEVEEALAGAHREERHLREVNEYLEGELNETKAKLEDAQLEIRELRSLIPKTPSPLPSGGEVA